ncbi:uncharacterized protein EHS24_001459 [Apiotrichum porosum]|uniref:Uncharacterized protein n=1 Tax=Apiotrichum porosum TaxID=105984 RepID=A0A427XKT5_9TREE|nr:uncharacterized protein EHS24_001459 [Apiotrichum porosum]RSH79413.1 hypothetical protein EHS24_001459 [Apiotrichum porosum]
MTTSLPVPTTIVTPPSRSSTPSGSSTAGSPDSTSATRAPEQWWQCSGNHAHFNLGRQCKPVPMRLAGEHVMGCLYCRRDLSFLPKLPAAAAIASGNAFKAF